MQGKPSDDAASISAVYSLAVQREALWLLSGLENGGINLQSVRHDEGKRISCLRGHTSAVSVLSLAADEKSCLSGSWDKTVLDWDLNTGKTVRSFEGSAGQISALQIRPTSDLPVPEFTEIAQEALQNGRPNNVGRPSTDGFLSNGIGPDSGKDDHQANTEMNGAVASPADSLFGGNDADSLFGDNETIEGPSMNFDDDDNDFSRAIASGLQEQSQGNQDGTAGGDEDMADVPAPINAPTTSGDISGTTHQQLDPRGIPSQAAKAEPSEGTTRVIPVSEESIQPDQPTSDAAPSQAASNSGSTFLAASIDGSLRIWDRRQQQPVARITPYNVPPWCMNACWSPDGNHIYAGRRNGTVDVYSLHAGLQKPFRNLKLPNNSGAVSAVQAMPNGRHLIWYAPF